MTPARPLRFLPALFLMGSITLLALQGCGSKPAGGGSPGSDSTSPAPSESAAAPPPAAIPTVVSLELGEKVFKQRCVLCHGTGGHGDGAAAAALKPHPRNFHDAAYMKSRTDDQLLVTIHNGKGPMPAWKTILSEVEMRSALLYVRQFARTP